MRIKPIEAFFVFLLASVLAPSALAFDVYVETVFKNQPDFAQYGAKDGRTHLGMIYEGSIFGKGSDRQLLPPKNCAVSLIEQRYKDYAGLFAIDIESWGLTGSDDKVSANMQKYLTVLGWIKDALPKATVGYYGVVPISGYSATQVSETHERFKDWQARNDRIVAIGKAVEATFPGLYPVNPNKKGWVKWAVGTIREARRIAPGKKVYPFINPRYHSRAKAYHVVDISFDPVPYDYFLLQLNTLKQHADGVVIWNGSRRPWNANEPWWQATLEFLGSNNR